MEHISAWKKYSEKDIQVVYKYADEYTKFLSENKTERECCDFFEAEAKKQGYVNLKDLIASNKKVKSGDNR